MFTIFKKNTKSITTLFTDNFVDIHSHLIPGIDDGSKSVEESISLLKKMRSFGIKNFVVTPHIMKGVWEIQQIPYYQNYNLLKII